MSTPWAARDIGSPSLSGAASQSGGTFTIDAAGRDIWDTSDQFHFVYQAVAGDVEIRAKVESVTQEHAWSKAGVMIRGSLTAGAAHAYALSSAGKGVAFQRRPAENGTSEHTSGTSAAPPRWVRLKRVGTTVTASTSADGVNWTTIGSDTVALGSTVYVGVAVTSHDAGARTRAVVSNVTVAGASSALPAGYSTSDVGAPAVTGSATHSSGTFTIAGAGADIWDSADQFRYVYQQVTGDIDIIARVAALQYVDQWSKAGVMIRESLDPGAPHASMLLSAGRGYAFQRRPSQDAWSEHTNGGSGVAPGWVRLVRTGTTFDAYRSADGRTWTKVGSRTIVMDAAVYVGLAVTSHNTSRATTSVIDNVAVTAAPADVRTPTVTITSPANGATMTAPATIALTATASSPDTTIASVAFYSGTTLVARDTTSPYSASISSVPAGTYTFTALVTDGKGRTATSASVKVTVGTATSTAPKAVAFLPSADHAIVTRYVLEIYRSGTTPGSSTPVTTKDLGKPAAGSNGEIYVDAATLFQGLPAGTYLATVSAVGSGGSSRSTAVSFTR